MEGLASSGLRTWSLALSPLPPWGGRGCAKGVREQETGVLGVAVGSVLSQDLGQQPSEPAHLGFGDLTWSEVLKSRFSFLR